MLLWKKAEAPATLTVRGGKLEGIPDYVPLVRVAGVVPPGSEGNAAVTAAFERMSQEIDIQSSSRGLLVYDMLDLQYVFGDHVGAFFWNLPALLDGVAIVAAATGATRRNLESLQQFIGPWLPVAFCDSLDSISAQVRGASQTVQSLWSRRNSCSQRGQRFMPGETGVNIVLLGSRQTGQQYRTRKPPGKESDLDCGVVGGPRELALLAAKLRMQPDLLQNLEHPPIKTYSSEEEAVNQGLLVVGSRATAAT